MGLFHPDCNAHRLYIEVLPGLTALQSRRKDFNFRNAFEKYKPNKPNGNLSAGKSKSSGARGRDRSNGKSNSSEGKSKKDMRGVGKEKASHYGVAANESFVGTNGIFSYSFSEYFCEKSGHVRGGQ